MDNFIIRSRNCEVKLDRDLVGANFRRLAEVILGRRTPRWQYDSGDGDPPIPFVGRDPYLDLVATAEAALATLEVGVAT